MKAGRWILCMTSCQMVVRYGLLNIIDDFNRETLAIEVDFLSPAIRLKQTLEQLIEWRGNLHRFAVTMGRSTRVTNWRNGPKATDITLNFIQLGKPQQNAYIEHYNWTVRYDWLFSSLDELQHSATEWVTLSLLAHAFLAVLRI